MKRKKGSLICIAIMGFNCLPNELIRNIISYLDIKCLKQMCLTSKKMHSYAGKRLWSKPRFSSRQDLDFVQKISHFPILELHTNDFKCSWLELLCLVPQLKLLHIDTEKCYQNAETVQKSQLRFLTRLPVAVVVHTRAFKVEEYNEND